MPQMNGFEVLKQLKGNETPEEIASIYNTDFKKTENKNFSDIGKIIQNYIRPKGLCLSGVFFEKRGTDK